MGRSQSTYISKCLEEVDSSPHGWLWGVQDFSEGSNCRCGGNSKRTRSGAWRCDWIAAISWKNFNGWGVASYGWAKKVVPWVESAPGEDAVKIVEMTTKDLEYYVNLVRKAGFERIDSNLSLWFKCYQIALHATGKLFRKGRVNWQGKLHCCLILRNCHSHSSQQPSTLRQDPPPAARLPLAEGSDDG